MSVSECPACTLHIPLPASMQEGDIMICPDCGAKLKLVQVYPPMFEIVREE